MHHNGHIDLSFILLGLNNEEKNYCLVISQSLSIKDAEEILCMLWKVTCLLTISGCFLYIPQNVNSYLEPPHKQQLNDDKGVKRWGG